MFKNHTSGLTLSWPVQRCVAHAPLLKLGLGAVVLGGICLALALPTAALAQENPFSINGLPQKHGIESIMGVDQIDPLSGICCSRMPTWPFPATPGLPSK